MTKTDNNLLVFMLDHTACCIKSSSVQSVIEPPEHITAIPGSNAYRPGLFSHWKKPVAIYDLRVKFDMPTSQRGKIILSTLNGRLFGFWVDKIQEIANTEKGQLQPLPAECPKELFNAVLVLKQQMVFKTSFELLSTSPVTQATKQFFKQLNTPATITQAAVVNKEGPQPKQPSLITTADTKPASLSPSETAIETKVQSSAPVIAKPNVDKESTATPTIKKTTHTPDITKKVAPVDPAPKNAIQKQTAERTHSVSPQIDSTTINKPVSTVNDKSSFRTDATNKRSLQTNTAEDKTAVNPKSDRFTQASNTAATQTTNDIRQPKAAISETAKLAESNQSRHHSLRNNKHYTEPSQPALSKPENKPAEKPPIQKPSTESVNNNQQNLNTPDNNTGLISTAIILLFIFSAAIYWYGFRPTYQDDEILSTTINNTYKNNSFSEQITSSDIDEADEDIEYETIDANVSKQNIATSSISEKNNNQTITPDNLTINPSNKQIENNNIIANKSTIKIKSSDHTNKIIEITVIESDLTENEPQSNEENKSTPPISENTELNHVSNDSSVKAVANNLNIAVEENIAADETLTQRNIESPVKEDNTKLSNVEEITADDKEKNNTETTTTEKTKKSNLPTKNTIDSASTTSLAINNKVFEVITNEEPIKETVPGTQLLPVTKPNKSSINTKANISSKADINIKAKVKVKPRSNDKLKSKRIQHTVVKGDTLWHIAKRYINDPYKYPQLAKLSKIKNPDLIYPGDIVIINIIKKSK